MREINGENEIQNKHQTLTRLQRARNYKSATNNANIQSKKSTKIVYLSQIYVVRSTANVVRLREKIKSLKRVKRQRSSLGEELVSVHSKVFFSIHSSLVRTPFRLKH
jgi:hypothetical protein